MRTRLAATLAALLPLALAACAAGPAAPAAQPAPGGQPSPPATLQPTAGPTLAPAAGTATPGGALTIEEATDLVRADLAGVLGAPAAAINVVTQEPRLWPDSGLGCRERRGMGEGVQVPGYLIVLGYADRSYSYHTDRAGAFVRCELPARPIDPIR